MNCWQNKYVHVAKVSSQIACLLGGLKDLLVTE